MPATLADARLESGRILSAKFLREATSKNDMVKRLSVVLRRLREDDTVEANNPQEYPGLAALCQYLTRLVNHRDKEIRLYTVAACMELFTVYAPEAPWNELETLEIFKQTIRQLANLGHSLRAPAGGASRGRQNRQLSTNDAHFYQYYRILELLAEVKIAVLLVDLSKKNDENHREGDEDDIVDGKGIDEADDEDSSDDSSTTNDNHDDSRRRSPRHRRKRKQKVATGTSTKKRKPKVNINQEALQILTELFRTLLQSVRNEHPTEIFDFCQKTLTSCVEEFFESIILPVPILDELLVCIGQGPRVLVLQQQQTRSKETNESRTKRGRKRNADGTTPPALVAVQQNNPSYMVASAVVRASVDRLSTPIATLLNGLVNSDPRSIGQSIISNHSCDDGGTEESVKKKNGVAQEVLDMVNRLGRPQRQQQDIHGTSNVYSVILELHRVAPAILTTVFGNLSSHVDTTDVAQRMLVVQTLGKLFAGNQSKSSAGANLQVAYQYNPCFRKWLQRSKDRLLEIRRIMLPHLLALIKAGSPFLAGGEVRASSSQAELAKDVQEVLLQMLTDESSELRNEIIQELCSLSYQHRKILSRRLMDHLGERVMAKDKTERKYALTGLVQLYFQQYIRHHLATVLEGGDDCPIESVLEVLNKCCKDQSSASRDIGLTSLIAARSKASSLSSAGGRNSPRKSKKKRRNQRASRSRSGAVPDSDQSDHSDDEYARNQDLSFSNQDADDFSYYQWIPCVLFESASYSDATDSDMHSRVVQLVDELLLGCSSPHPENRRQLTSTGRATGLAVVVDAVRNQSNVSWLWMRELQSTRAKLQKTLKNYLDARKEIRKFETGTEAYFAADAKAKDILERVASMIPQPSGTSTGPEERHPVLEKFHSIKDKHVFRLLGTIANPNHSAKARARALDDLPKRVKATVGDTVHAWVKSLAKRCAMGDFINHDTIHHCVLLAQECFHEGEYEATLKFLVCIQLAVESFPSICASDEVFSNLSELFTDCNSSSSKASRKTDLEHAIVTALSAILASVSPYRESGKVTPDFEADLQKKLVALCQNGTPEQARHAVSTMASLFKYTDDGALEQDETDSYVRLLETLATPSRLAISATGSSTRLICVLSALAELADHAPTVFERSNRGGTVLKFALEMVLMGRAHISNDNDEYDLNSSSDSDEEFEDEKTSKSGRTALKPNDAASGLNASGGAHNLVEDENLSVSCRTLCIAIEFLSTFIRSSVFAAKKTRSILSQTSLDLISQVFNILSNILRDRGMPPSSKDRKACRLRQDRAALRQCAAINLFRLCDTRLGLDQKYLTPERWHYLASSLLDEDLVVRRASIEELGLMFTCNGKFAATQGLGAMAPRLRFVAMSVFCIDGSQGFHSKANGNAANIGRNINKHKREIAECVAHLRKVYEENAALCRAQGDEAEERFETLTKLTVMPEYSIPYAIHLLACRDETPSSAHSGRRNMGKAIDDRDYEVDETGQKVLRKRLKSLYDPIVLQLGASADNISFLLRMAEMLAKSFQPIGYPSFSMENDDGERELDKLTNVCATAREVLLSYVKKDVNLDTHPGAIRMPGNLFRKIGTRKRSAQTQSKSSLMTKTIKTIDNVSAWKAVDTKSTGSKKIVGNKRSTLIAGSDSKMHEGKNNAGLIRSSTASSANHDHIDSKSSASTISGLRNEDITFESIEDGSQRRTTRRSTRSTRSAKFDDPNDSKLSDRFGAEVERVENRNLLSIDSASANDSVDNINFNSPEEKENPFGTRSGLRSNKKRRSELSQGSLPSGRVHFSPEADFGGLTPINRRESGGFERDKTLLSSSETKTRGTTPPSSLRDSNFQSTASPAVSNARSMHNAKSPTTISESTMDHSIGIRNGHGKKKPFGNRKVDLNQSRQKNGTGKVPLIDKENADASMQKKQNTKQIKVVRSKPSLNHKAKAARTADRARTTKRTRGRKSKPADTFAFEG